MYNFEFSYPTRLIFGKEQRFRIGAELKAAGASRVLIVYGGGSAVRSGLIGMVHESLVKEGIDYLDFGGIRSNPELSKVIEGIALCRSESIDFILACGGGSVIDSSKAIALGAANDINIWETIATWAQPDKALPISVLLTLPAAASETGCAFVISCDETKQKLLYACPKVFPKFAIVDPELFLSIPKKVYGPAICDMMSHVIECYFTVQDHTEVSDGICESTMRTLIRNGRRLLKGDNSYEVWSELALAANVAHNGMCGLGRLPEWSCHMIEHEISAFYGVSHGAGLTVLTPAWMKYIYKDNLPFFAQFAVKIMGLEPNTRALEELALDGIEALTELYREFDMPTTMRELGIHDDSLYETMAKRAVGFDANPEARLGYLAPLSWENVIEIFRLAE
ncbi:MAG: iron-containing alcohol dehydrogenase [Oscillospiraceae bacterium]|nr:iron-containing alcohol dehydrogenase [Oscillospiraceae bacterium]